MPRIAYSRLVRAALLVSVVPLLGGCLIVRTHELVIEDECPTIEPTRIADASGPFVIASGVYFFGRGGVLSYVDYEGGAISELTNQGVNAVQLAADATGLYWATFDGAIVRRPYDGSPEIIAEGFTSITQLVVTAEHVTWASHEGLVQWRKADQTISIVDASDAILGLDADDTSYYLSDARTGVVRRTEPPLELAHFAFPGPLAVSAGNVYFYEAGEDPFADYAGSLRIVPSDGGSAAITAKDLPPVLDIAGDGMHLVLGTAHASEYRIKRVSRFGGAVRTMACGRFGQQPLYVAINPLHLWWSDSAGLYRIDPSQIAPY
jgi:hypothetical protein